MKPVFAIALLAIRSAARSKVIVILIAMLLAAIIGLPLTIKGDGTVAGYVQVLLKYTLGFASLLLSISTLWAGCAAVSSEIHARQMHLVVTKPVHRFQVWLGKWLGLVLMNVLLLSLSGALIYGLLRWTLRPATLTAEESRVLNEELLIARQPLRPVPVDVEEPARKLLATRMAAVELPENVHPDDLLNAIREQLLRQAFTVPPGASRAWTFVLPESIRNESFLFRFRLSASQMGATSVRGEWTVRCEGVDDSYETVMVSPANRLQSFSLPIEYVRPGRVLHVSYENLHEDHTVIFPHDEGLIAYLYEGDFAMNFIRELLLIFAQLSLLAAVGVTAGTLFSMSVAALVAIYCLIIVQAGAYITGVAEQSRLIEHTGHHHGPVVEEIAPAGLMEHAVKGLFAVMSVIVKPLQAPNTLEWLSNGQLVPWHLVGETLAIKVIVYTGILGLLSACAFKKKEVGLPQ
ncbi:MAG: ABC transporter permease [Verrucomicrobia bacterium]|nr:ABC transporter permease [Verrucomicrobiota bacterium]